MCEEDKVEVMSDDVDDAVSIEMLGTPLPPLLPVPLGESVACDFFVDFFFFGVAWWRPLADFSSPDPDGAAAVVAVIVSFASSFLWSTPFNSFRNCSARERFLLEADEVEDELFEFAFEPERTGERRMVADGSV